MHKETELELKFRLSPESAQALMQHPLLKKLAPPQTKELKNQYYDTASQDFLRLGYGFRIRTVNGQGPYIQTLKSQGDNQSSLHTRLEWNIEQDHDRPQLAFMQDYPELATLSKAVSHQALIPLFCTHFTRQSWIVHTTQGGRIAIECDQGQIISGDKQVPLRECEIEIQQGAAIAGLLLAYRLARRVPLIIEINSKAAYGYRLAGVSRKEQISKTAPNTIAKQLQAAFYQLLQSQDQFIHSQNHQNALALRDKILQFHELVSKLMQSSQNKMLRRLHTTSGALCDFIAQVESLAVFIEQHWQQAPFHQILIKIACCLMLWQDS